MKQPINSYPPAQYRPNKRILWLLGSGDNTKRKQYIVKKMQEVDSTCRAAIHFIDLNKAYRFWVKKPKTKGTFMLTTDYREVLSKQLEAYLPNSTVVVCNDFGMLSALLAGSGGTGSKKKLASFRGSRYYHELTGGLPTIVLDDVSKAYIPTFGKTLTGSTPQQCDQFIEYDMQKIARHYWGKNNDIGLVSFDQQYQCAAYVPPVKSNSWTYSHVIDNAMQDGVMVPSTWRNNNHTDYKAERNELLEFKEWVNSCSMLSIDFETTINFISCFSITGVQNHDISTIKTWTVPFINTTKKNQQHMPYGRFYEYLWLIANAPAPKVYMNGSYDSHYQIKYNTPPLNFSLDIMHMWHSYRSRMPKSLADISSIFCDQYYYWKDEIKGGSTEKKTQTKYALPVTEKGLEVYWRYAGQDTYYTLLCGLALLPVMTENPWALENYGKEMATQMGPLMTASYRGCRLDSTELKQLLQTYAQEASDAAEELMIASNGITGHSCTNAEVANWLYDVLKAKVGKKGRTVDQKQLLLVAEQHPIYRKAIELVHNVRAPKKRVEMYQKMKYENKRFQYKYSIAGTYTGRLSGKASDFWVGTNPQNIPAIMRSFVCSDHGKVLIDIDYSAADLYHFAVACGDATMLQNVFSDADTHAMHVDMVLGVPYADVVAGKKEGADWVVHPIRGVRQIAKKYGHGGNYGMTPPTAYLNIGRESLIAAARILGLEGSEKWTYSRFLDFTEQLTNKYVDSYPMQRQYRKDVVQQCVENEGLMTCCGGLTTYFHEWNKPRERDSLMRALLAYAGQGGTAGMINDAIMGMYYGDGVGGTGNFLRASGIDLLLQTHDSITFQCDWDKVVSEDIINKLLIAMEITCKFNGKEYVVPCEVNVGPRWSKKMPEVKRDANATTQTLCLLQSFVELNA